MDPEVKPGGSATSNRGDGLDEHFTGDSDIIHNSEVSFGCRDGENKPGQAATPSDQKLEETCTRHSLSKESSSN